MTMATSAVIGGPTVFRDTRADLVESPWWDDGALYWADIALGELHISPADGPVDGSGDTVIRMPAPLASFHPAVGGGFVVALGDRVVLADPDGTIRTELGTVEHGAADMRLNEGKVDPQGRFVVGSLDLKTGVWAGAWYRVDGDGAQTLSGGVGCANGLEWSLDESTVYMTDTMKRTIYRATWDADTGPGPLEPFSTGQPSDGLVIDADGCFWNARYGEGCVARLDPDGNEVERVDVPAPNVAGIAFGGADRSVLYIGTARENLSLDRIAEVPLSGGIFAVQTTTHGLPVRRYGAR